MRRARPRHARTTVRGKFRYTSAPAFTFTPGKARRVETLCVCGLSYGNSVRNEFTRRGTNITGWTPVYARLYLFLQSAFKSAFYTARHSEQNTTLPAAPWRLAGKGRPGRFSYVLRI